MATRTKAMRTSYLDRTWLEHWTVLALTPINPPDLDELHSKMLDFMEHNADHPLSCTLSADGRKWIPVPPNERASHLATSIVRGPAVDDAADDPHAVLMEQRPMADSGAPYKVVIGKESMILYFAHVAGDAVIFSPFSVAMALGAVDELQPLRANAGLPTALKMFGTEVATHWREWWSHMSSAPRPASSVTALLPEASVTEDTVAVGVELSVQGYKDFREWRKVNCPDMSATALMASATYLAFADEGLPIDRDGFYTLVDLRRHLPKDQAMRPGNLAKSLNISADLSDPGQVDAAMKATVGSARGVPSLLVGAVGEMLSSPSGRSPAGSVSSVRMTFNSMMRNPGVERIPWTDPSQARYLGMSYPVGGEGISVFACGIEGKICFSASFDPRVLSRDAVRRAMARLQDLPALLETAAVSKTSVNEQLPISSAAAG